jgi:hypothetical protein
MISASDSGHADVVKLLLAKTVSIGGHKDTIGWTHHLSYAAKNEHEMVVMAPVTHKFVDSHTRDNYSASPLSIAATGNCRTEDIKLVLGTGYVDLNSWDYYGRSPLS